MRLALAAECEAARNSGPHAHNVLEAFDREFVDSNQGEAIAGRGFLELVGGNFTLLEEPQDLLGCFLDFGFEGFHPVLDGGGSPSFGGVILEGGVGWLEYILKCWWLVWWGCGITFGWGAGAACILLGGGPGRDHPKWP